MLQKYKDMTTRQKIKANLILVALAAFILVAFSVVVPIMRGDGASINYEGRDTKFGMTLHSKTQTKDIP